MNYRETLYRNYSDSLKRASNDRVQHAVFNKSYPKLPDKKSSLIGDLGCGQGVWLRWLAGLGYDNLVGIDLSRAELTVAQQTPAIRWIHGQAIEVLRKTEERFDLLHCKDLLEHLTKDEAIAFLTACNDALAPGGELWIWTFNAQAWFAPATYYGDFTHELALTPSSLAQALRATHFEVVSVQGYHGCPPTPKGRLRRSGFRLLDFLGRRIIEARHGRSTMVANVDCHTTLPDIFARARRPVLSPKTSPSFSRPSTSVVSK
jgi:2-polyprenyl-3-methyl-5-hydroxy-6-metoxy-1,4-benzoquinol methylase